MSCQQATHTPDPPRRALGDRQDALGGYFAGCGADVSVKHVDRMHMPGVRVGVFLPHGCQRARTLRNLRKRHRKDDRTGVYAHVTTFYIPIIGLAPPASTPPAVGRDYGECAAVQACLLYTSPSPRDS